MSIFIADQAQYAQSPEFPWSPTPFPAFDDGISLGSPTPVPSETSRVSDSVRQHSALPLHKAVLSPHVLSSAGRFLSFSYCYNHTRRRRQLLHRTRATPRWWNSLPCFRRLCAFGTYPTSVDGMFRECIRMCDLFHEPVGCLRVRTKHGDIVHDCFTDANRPGDLSDRGQGSSRKRWTDITDAPTKTNFLKNQGR